VGNIALASYLAVTPDRPLSVAEKHLDGMLLVGSCTSKPVRVIGPHAVQDRLASSSRSYSGEYLCAPPPLGGKNRVVPVRDPVIALLILEQDRGWQIDASREQFCVLGDDLPRGRCSGLATAIEPDPTEQDELERASFIGRRGPCRCTIH
jgi:hypothetical protein